jgi:formylglycine-generating enzyme required for sulfatase activity
MSIESGSQYFPLVASPVILAIMPDYFLEFLDYYGLRIPTYHEWLYAARGTGQPYFPWSSEDNCVTWGDWGNNSCSVSCVDQAFCIDSGWPYSMDGFYEGGAYENSSPFGVYDIIGNAPEAVIEESDPSATWYNTAGFTAGTTWYIDNYTNTDVCVSSEAPFSFCYNNHFIYELNGADSFGLRLVRTVTGE